MSVVVAGRAGQGSQNAKTDTSPTLVRFAERPPRTLVVDEPSPHGQAFLVSESRRRSCHLDVSQLGTPAPTPTPTVAPPPAAAAARSGPQLARDTAARLRSRLHGFAEARRCLRPGPHQHPDPAAAADHCRAKGPEWRCGRWVEEPAPLYVVCLRCFSAEPVRLIACRGQRTPELPRLETSAVCNHPRGPLRSRTCLGKKQR